MALPVSEQPCRESNWKSQTEKKKEINLLDIIIEQQGGEAVRGRGLGEKGSPKIETWYMASFLLFGVLLL